jgi:hypothetical protein
VDRAGRRPRRRPDRSPGGDARLRRIAGVFVILSAALGTRVNPWFHAFTAFVGFNLFQSSLTNFCPLEKILGRFGLFGCRPARG